MGAVDYANMWPKDSFIDVKDFASPKKLAQHIQYLDENDEAYNRYVLNKRSLVCRSVEPSIPWHCRMCDYFKINKDNVDVVHDVTRFWGMRRCQTPEEFFQSKKDNDFNVDFSKSKNG
jgi:hypothetical protein